MITHAPPDLLRVFIVGCPRSGTTLLQALLGANADVASFPESHLFIRPEGVRTRLTAGQRARMNLKRFACIVEAGALYSDRKFALGPQPYQRDFVRLLDQLTRAHQKRVWIEKTPNHVLSIREIRKVTPSSRFVHLIRDGRAVVASLYEVTREHTTLWGRPLTLDECIREWNRAIVAASAAMHTANDGIIVKYEKLVADPVTETRRLCEFLHLDYDPHMATAYSAVAPAIIGSQEPWKNRVGRPIQDLGLQKYHSLLSREQRSQVEASLIELPAALRIE